MTLVGGRRLTLALLGLLGCGAATPSAAPLLERHDLHSVPDLLGALPESVRSQSVLLFETRSPQGASYEAPRVIFFGDDARRVFAFGGSTDSVDVMTFDDEARAFRFQEVTFPLLADVPTMSVSEPNPERCRACHGTPARPVWDTYPVWPGAYGETVRAPPSPDEVAGLAHFAEARASHPRYRFVPERTETAAAKAERRYHGEATVASNARLGELLAALDARVFARELAASPAFSAHRYGLLSALSPQCRTSADATPAFAAFAANTRQANTDQATYKQWRAHGAARAMTPRTGAAADAPMTRLRFLAESELGVPTRGWTLALEKGTYDFAVSDRPAESLESRLFAELAGDDTRALELAWHGIDPSALCAYLAQHEGPASPGAVGALAPQPGEPLLGLCADCHERGVGPRIAFDHPQDLAPQLARRTKTHATLLDTIRFRLTPEAGAKRMPMVRNASAEEQAQLMAYLEGLVAQARYSGSP